MDGGRVSAAGDRTVMKGGGRVDMAVSSQRYVSVFFSVGGDHCIIVVDDCGVYQ